MADDEDKGSKTEDPTEKKLKDAHDKGQDASSREVPIAVSLMCFTAYLIMNGGELFTDTANGLRFYFANAGEIDLTTGLDASQLFQHTFRQLIGLLAPLCVLLMIGGILASALQNEPRLVLERIKPKWNKISIAKGLTRMFGKQGWMEFAKNLGKLTVTGFAVFLTLWASVDVIMSGIVQSPVSYSAAILKLIDWLLIIVCVSMVIIATADMLWARHSWFENLRMSRKEISDETKQAEGDPILKARMRSIARDRHRHRMFEAVPFATMLVTNPTHVSVALRFDEGRDEAPVVVAKGQDLIALKIREMAREHGVPIFEKIELARALNKSVEIDQIIPAEFYTAVAELINIIYSKGPEGVRQI
ncbi:MAG: flagellar biosynthesis protein FlhB [Pseudomonadota bacterium]